MSTPISGWCDMGRRKPKLTDSACGWLAEMFVSMIQDRMADDSKGLTELDDEESESLRDTFEDILVLNLGSQS